MAKTTIGLGQFSGRVGGIVYAVQAGRQVVRAYQPVVSNPKSTAQSIQRAKGNLVGRISKITPWQILEGLGDNKFKRRSRFLQLLLRNVTAGQAAGNPSQFNAKLVNSGFVFSEGTLIPLHSPSAATASANNVDITVSTSGGVSADAAAAQGLLVVVVIKQSNGYFEEVLYRFVTAAEVGSSSFSFSLNHRNEGAYTASIYAAPFGTADGSRLPTISGDLTSTANSLDALLSVGTAASSIVWGNSYFVRNADFNPEAAASKSKKSE